MASIAIDPATRQPAFRPARPDGWRADAGWMLLLALALRCWWFGNPVIQVDEQFYLLVGDRMLHGALPFVDIWDRKPIGLFLIFAAIRLLGGSGIVEYQIVAAGFAAAAALLVVRIARLHAGAFGARAAGAGVLLWLMVFDGAGGQAPIFYGPLVAAAALISFRALLRDGRREGALLRDGALAMLLIGLAIQIKYTVVFEGIGFGCMLLWRCWREGRRAGSIAAHALAWTGIALAPTLLAFLFYARHGEAAAFAYANFLSIGDRTGPTLTHLARRLLTIALLAAPLIAAAVTGLRMTPADEPGARFRPWLKLWLVAALIGFLAVGTLYKHYFLPVLLPLAVAAAPALEGDFGRRLQRASLLAGIGAILALVTGVHRREARGGEAQVAAIVSAIRPRLGDRLFVFDGEPILYYLTGSRLSSPYAFPNHLNERNEAGAIGVDPVREVRRILAERPSVIVSSDRPAKDGNPRTWAIMRHALARNYRIVAAIPVNRRLRIVYRRDDRSLAIAAG